MRRQRRHDSKAAYADRLGYAGLLCRRSRRLHHLLRRTSVRGLSKRSTNKLHRPLQQQKSRFFAPPSVINSPAFPIPYNRNLLARVSFRVRASVHHFRSFLRFLLYLTFGPYAPDALRELERRA